MDKDIEVAKKLRKTVKLPNDLPSASAEWQRQLNKAITDPATLNKISTMFYERVIFIKLSTFNYKMVHEKGKALLEALNAHGY